jgi:hypothetical protein
MQTKYLIAIDDFCANHKIDISFISSLQQTGLIEITTIEDSGFIAADQLLELEKYVRFYYELDINLEGIETVTYLLQKINNLQNEIKTLNNKLRLYESELND